MFMKPKKRLFIFLCVVAGIIVLWFGGFIYHIAVTPSQKKAVAENYPGKCVSVTDGCMMLFEQGKGDTIVLLADPTSLTPILDFQPLIDDLSLHYHVVAVETFGHGNSTDTANERNVENIVFEIHQAISSLNLDTYTVLGHGFGYVYAKEYARLYKDEVTTLIGMDPIIDVCAEKMKFRKMSGIYGFYTASGATRFMTNLDANLFLPITYQQDYSYTKEELQMMTAVNAYRYGNKVVRKELAARAETIQKVSQSKLPNTIRVLYLTSDDMQRKHKWWTEAHEEEAEALNGYSVRIPGSYYYMHWLKYRAVSIEINKFNNKVVE